MIEKNVKMIDAIVKSDNNKSDGIVIDSDTILADVVEKADFEVTGLAHEIFDIYKQTDDKEAFEKLFYCLTGETFENYLLLCMNTIEK